MKTWAEQGYSSIVSDMGSSPIQSTKKIKKMQNIWLFEKIAVSLQQISKQTEITPTNTHVIAKEKLPCNIGG